LPKKNVIFFVLLITIIVVISIIIFRNIQNSVIRVPKIAISEEEWDFGKVMQEENPTHKFIITNKGNKDLIIEQVKASCGCVKTSISDNRILPGKTAELEAVFYTTGYERKVEKNIFIKSNDPDEPEKKLRVKIEIEHKFKPKINIPINELDMGVVLQGEIVSLNFIIENIGDTELIIKKIDTYDYIKYNAGLPLIILPKEKFHLILTYDSANHKIGKVREAVRLYCNDLTKESFFIKISGYIDNKESSSLSISTSGETIHLDSDSDENVMEKIILKNSGDENIKVISIKSSIDYLTPLRNEISLKSQEEQELQIVLLKEKAREEIKGDRAEEYLYLTIALPIKINK